MDQTTHTVEQDIKAIVATRLAIADKIRQLEQRMENAIHHSKQAIHHVVEEGEMAVTRLATMGTGTRIVARYSRERPWLLFGAAVALGFAAGRLTGQASRKVYPYYLPSAKGAEVMPEEGTERRNRPDGVYTYYPDRPVTASASSDPRQQEQPGPASFLFALAEGLRDEVTSELGRVQEAFLQAGRRLIRDIARDLIPTPAQRRPVEDGVREPAVDR